MEKVKQEVREFLIWYFCNYPEGRSKKLGSLWFKYKDTYGIPVPTLEKVTLRLANEFADRHIDDVYKYVMENDK